MKRLVTLVMVVLVSMSAWGCGRKEPPPRAGSDPVVPKEAEEVLPPQAHLPTEIKEFSGKWSGEWLDPADIPGYGAREILVVKEIVSPDRVRVFLVWGDCPSCGSKAGWQEFIGRISREDNKLTLLCAYPEGRVLAFYKQGDRLLGTDGYGAVQMERFSQKPGEKPFK